MTTKLEPSSTAVTNSADQSMVLLQALASADRRAGATATKTQTQFRDYRVTAEEGRQKLVEENRHLQAALVASESQNRQLVIAFAEEREEMAKEKATMEDRLKALEARAIAAEKIVEEKERIAKEKEIKEKLAKTPGTPEYYKSINPYGL